jgi:hypothetical protein
MIATPCNTGGSVTVLSVTDALAWSDAGDASMWVVRHG